MRSLFATLGLALAFRGAAQAQAARDLPIMSSLEYNVLYQEVSDPSLAHPWGSAYRFAGRLAVDVASRTYLGVGVGSWQTVSDICIGGACETNLHGSVSMAVMHQLFLQRYLVGRSGFARVGLGVARTETLRSDGDFIQGDVHWRPAASVGAGWDIAVARWVAITPSADAVRVFNVMPTGREIRLALALGLAVTVR
jgi:hypothetical protein